MGREGGLEVEVQRREPAIVILVRRYFPQGTAMSRILIRLCSLNPAPD
jgi:hypothetical protein